MPKEEEEEEGIKNHNRRHLWTGWYGSTRLNTVNIMCKVDNHAQRSMTERNVLSCDLCNLISDVDCATRARKAAHARTTEIFRRRCKICAVSE